MRKEPKQPDRIDMISDMVSQIDKQVDLMTHTIRDEEGLKAGLGMLSAQLIPIFSELGEELKKYDPQVLKRRAEEIRLRAENEGLI